MAQNNTEKKHAMNAFDVLLIIVVIAVVATVVANIVRSSPDIVSGGDKEIEYVIQVSEIPEALGDNVKAGDKLYDHESSQLIGTVTNVSLAQSEKLGYDYKGNPVYTPIEGKTDMLITLKVSVWAEGDSLEIDGFRISVGREISCRSQNIYVTGRCISITEA